MYTYICVCLCVCVCMYVCIYVSMYVCMYVCVYVYLFVCKMYEGIPFLCVCMSSCACLLVARPEHQPRWHMQAIPIDYCIPPQPPFAELYGRAEPCCFVS